MLPAFCAMELEHWKLPPLHNKMVTWAQELLIEVLIASLWALLSIGTHAVSNPGIP
jgi:hypothetical protein